MLSCSWYRSHRVSFSSLLGRIWRGQECTVSRGTLFTVLLLSGGQGVLGEDKNARVSLTQAASMTPGADPLGPALDYLISCTYSSRNNELLLLAGNNQGAVGCFPVAEPSAPGAICTFKGPQALLSGGHDSVRAPFLHFCMLGWLHTHTDQHFAFEPWKPA